jgi:hypothetical protein
LNPEALTFTAKVKMAPTTNRKMLTPRLTCSPPPGCVARAGFRLSYAGTT